MSRATSSHLHSLSSPTPLVYLLGYFSLHSLRVLVFLLRMGSSDDSNYDCLCLPIDFFSPHTHTTLLLNDASLLSAQTLLLLTCCTCTLLLFRFSFLFYMSWLVFENTKRL